MNELDRYTTDEMNHVWSADWKFRRWADVEIAAAKALGAPSEALFSMSGASVPSAQAVAAEEAKTRHDVIAFLNLWRAGMDVEARVWTHRGLTSSDIVDTTNALRMKASTDVIRDNLRRLTKVIVRNALLYKDTVRIGRTHGQSAEVTTWGWRLAGFAHDLMRAEQRFALLHVMYERGKLSGPVGDYKTMDPGTEQDALLRLGLEPVGAGTQVVPRDVYVDYVHCLAQTASVIENIALEVRLSSRSEVAEMREGTLGSQRGSSAMPHKRNPITSEQLSGLARLVRAQVAPVADGVALHHERDISHSSVERVALSTASKIADYMVQTATALMGNLRVYPERMRSNLDGNLDVLSSLIKDRLVDQYHLDPKDAYEVTFWGFHEWTRPAEDRGPDSQVFETLADALSDAFVRVAERKNWDPAFVADFDALTGLMEHPEKLVGQTGKVFAELEYVLSTL